MSLVVPLGCSQSTRGDGSASPTAGGPSTSASSSPEADAEFATFRTSFGLLETVAGKGSSDSGNEWQVAFEGSPAVDAELSRPHMAVADSAGNLYIADKEAHGIRRVTPAGIITTVAGVNASGNGEDSERRATEVALSNPNGVWVQADGTFYVVDLDNAKIRKVTPDGMMRTLFQVPGGIAIGRGLWIASDESEAFLCSGTELLRWTPGAGVEVHGSGFSDLGMVVRDDSGRLWVGDRGANRVYEILGTEKVARAGNGETGTFLEGLPALSTSLAGTRAVWPHGGGFFVGLHEGSRVVYVDARGYAHTFLEGARNAHAGDGEPFDTPGPKVSEIRSVTVSSAGDLIVVENDLGFVRRVRATR